MSNIDVYIGEVEKLLHRLKASESVNIDKASSTIAETFASGGWLYVFGTGHSHIVAEEFFYRAGGMVRVYPIFDTALMLHEGAVKSTSMERLSGYAKILLDNCPIKKGDTLIIASNSGRNAVPVEMAIEAKNREVKVIAITSLNHTRNVTSRHTSGKRLFELADIVIDNGGIFGDACVQVGEEKVAPTSTAINAVIINSIVARIAELLKQKNVDLEFYASSNTDKGEKQNMKYIAKYKGLVKSL